MPLTKTTIFPDRHLDEVVQELEKPTLKLVIIGNHVDFVVMADELAQNPLAVERKVIWLKFFPKELFLHFVNLPQNINNVLAFSCSTINKVSRIINIGEPQDYAILLAAYNDARHPRNN